MEEKRKHAWHHVHGQLSGEMNRAAEEAELAYGDIIGLPHPVSKKHPPLSMEQKAAQFYPFAALTGYDDAIAETGRYTDKRRELDENQKAAVDEKLRLLGEGGPGGTVTEVLYFVPDARKDGGEYRTVRGRVRKLDPKKRQLVMAEGTRIDIEEIRELEILPLADEQDR